MIAEMNYTPVVAVVGIFGAIIGVIYWVIKSRDKLVYKDVCEANRDCIETSIKDFKEFVKQRFDTLEELIKNVKRE